MQGFSEKYYPKRSEGVEIFPENPKGLTLQDNRTRDYLCPMKSRLEIHKADWDMYRNPYRAFIRNSISGMMK